MQGRVKERFLQSGLSLITLQESENFSEIIGRDRERQREIERELFLRFLAKLKNFKNCFKCPWQLKNTGYIFKEISNLHLIFFPISFFSLFVWISAKNRTKLRKVFNFNHRLSISALFT